MKSHAYISIILLMLLDWCTKYLFYDLRRGEQWMLITPLLNTGIGRSIPVPLVGVIVLSICIIIGLSLWIYKLNKKPLRAIFFVSGAIGNLLDRILYTGVRDFIDLHYWPVFNFADIYLTISFCLLCWIFYTESKRNAHD